MVFSSSAPYKYYTSMDAGVKHLSVHIYLVTTDIEYYSQLISRNDLSPIPSLLFITVSFQA